jgi:hypothetical protein
VVEFNEQDHSYTVEGVRYPSVTQILAALGFYGDAVKYFTEQSRDRGSFVHRIIQYHLAGELDEETIDPALRGYFDAWLGFERDTGFTAHTIEQPMFCSVNLFAGTPDLIGELRRDSIIDIKTGDPGPAAALQTAAYEILYGKSVSRFSLQLKQDGKYKLTAYQEYTDRKIFLAALSVYRWQVARNLRR